jgi:hypothetical protein
MKNCTTIILFMVVVTSDVLASDWEYATNPWQQTRAEKDREREIHKLRSRLTYERTQTPEGASKHSLKDLRILQALKGKQNGSIWFPGDRAYYYRPWKARHHPPHKFLHYESLTPSMIEAEIKRRNTYERGLKSAIRDKSGLGRLVNWLSSKWYGSKQ